MKTINRRPAHVRARRERAEEGNANMPHRTFNPAQRRSGHLAGAGTRIRPLTRLRTINETAEILNVSPRTVRRFIDCGALPVHRFGRAVRISDADIAAFLAANHTV
jgi:excisionase family DNA binding protein